MMRLDKLFPEFETHVSNMSDGDVRLSVKSAERMCGCVDGRVEAQEEPASEIVHCRDCRHWRIAGDMSCPCLMNSIITTMMTAAISSNWITHRTTDLAFVIWARGGIRKRRIALVKNVNYILHFMRKDCKCSLHFMRKNGKSSLHFNMETIELDKENQRQLMMIRNIIKDGDGYKLQNNYCMDGDKLKWVVSYQNSDNHQCELCPHFTELSGGKGCCDILNELFGVEPNAFVWSGLVLNCAAYDPIKRLNIVRSMDEMIAFIVKVKNFFKNFESYEAYFGFHLSWDEGTGENLETVEDYYKRGGEFESIPTRYPSVICFDRNAEEDLGWIYIGE